MSKALFGTRCIRIRTFSKDTSKHDPTCTYAIPNTPTHALVAPGDLPLKYDPRTPTHGAHQKPYSVISGHFGAKMRILSSKSQVSTNITMRTGTFLQKKQRGTPRPGDPRGAAAEIWPICTHPQRHTKDHFRSFFASKTRFCEAKAHFRCSKWPYKVILERYWQISHTYTNQGIETASLNSFLKRFEYFSKSFKWYIYC